MAYWNRYGHVTDDVNVTPQYG